MQVESQRRALSYPRNFEHRVLRRDSPPYDDPVMTIDPEDIPMRGEPGPDEDNLRDALAWPPDDIGPRGDTCEGRIRDEDDIVEKIGDGPDGPHPVLKDGSVITYEVPED